MYSENKVINQINVLPELDSLQVQWTNQVLKDGEVIASTYSRSAYGQGEKDQFLLAVGVSGINYLKALGWA